MKEHVSSATAVWVDALIQDVRQAYRSLRSSRAYSMWVVGSLTIGVAVTVAALAVLNATLVAPFPEVTSQQELVRVSMLRNCGRPDCWIRMATPADYEHASQNLTGVRGLAAYAIGKVVVGLPDARSVQGVVASANYFDVLGVQKRPQVAIVNDAAAKGLTGPAVGNTLRVAPRTGDFQSSFEVRIVGVVETAIEPRLERGGKPAAKIYLPSPIQPEPALSLYARTSGPPAALARAVRELVSEIGPRVPISEIGSLTDFNERSYATQLWLARAAVLLGAIGLLLATAGLYGVSSYVVALRGRELAIRMAIGAAPRTILVMILRQSMRVAVLGLLVGGSAAVVVSRWIQSEYHGILGIDGQALGGAAGLFMVAMLLAAVVPAVRASRIDPVENLR